ncbi:hypothetical protein [Paenibacillus apiarius]|uniref:Collagen-like protein n=1 Tax=Paenibacillus apiarius TaxID=46240 RepID=A0ABT4DZD5_9BACL|nr:hypothetical protein [Paenibacillus apiarius]MCY9515180.1 hypothetical protein [Paenibacillus apiarius]MCY9522719.1 hypothetical protein [Paenibacillus apiarius]MCY9552939.1 hypothetical protein [Paenibacillus apiarius]MCY9557644.1 hypothetical protein [Paenibacillus apiarius]MCY9681883.1 hypothetical protein [Paenibacillus apiarius]
MTEQNKKEIKENESSEIEHAAGTNGVDGSHGIDGSNGLNGVNGINGIDGEGSSLGLDGDTGLSMDIEGIKLNIDVAKLIQQLISLSNLQK